MKRFIDLTGIKDYLSTLDLPQQRSNRAMIRKIEFSRFAYWLYPRIVPQQENCRFLRQASYPPCAVKSN